MLINLIKKSFKIVVDSPVITLFLVMYLILMNLLLFNISNSLRGGLAIVAFILFSCVYLLSACFFAGWYNIIVASFKDEDFQNKKSLPIFLEGVGKNFLPISIGMFVNFVILISFIIAASFVAYHFAGGLDFLPDEITASAVEKIADSLTEEQQYQIAIWEILFALCALSFSYLFMFYYPAVIEDEGKMLIKPFKAVWTSIKFVFRNFWSVLALNTLIFVSYFALGVLRNVFSKNSILELVILFISIYFISIVLVLIFYYYEQKNSCNNGADCLGEDKAIDSTCEKD